MTGRSSRNKIRWQLTKAAEKVDKVLVHLKYAEELSGGLSDEMEQDLPFLVAAALEFQKAIVRFREAL